MNIGKKGFTLTELLVVVLVMAILASIAVPLYTKTVRKSYASDAMGVLSSAAQKQENYFINNGKYADGFTQLGAPVKGLEGDKTVSEAGVVVGNFKYFLSNSCVAAVSLTGDAASDKDDYVIYKNFTTQQEGCVGKGCDMLDGVIENVSAVGCPAVSNTTPTEDPATITDPCIANPAACCPGGTTWNGTKCVGMECPSGKVYDSLTKACVCGVQCSSGGVQDPATCACTCTNTCQGGQVKDAACNCYCPTNLPNWDATNSKCSQACIGARTRWDSVAGQCACPLERPLWNNTSCVSCPMGKSWDGDTMSCVCPQAIPNEWSDGTCRACAQSGAAALKSACLSTAAGPAGKWTDIMCSCDCQEQNSIYSGGHCVCPPAKPIWNGSSCMACPDIQTWNGSQCVCPDSKPNWNGSSCIACTGTTPVWNGSQCVAKTCPNNTRPLSSEVCQTCGERTRTVTCDPATGEWVTGAWSTCDKSGCLKKDACCCGNGVEITNTGGVSCSSFNYTPKLQACVCAQDHCDSDDASLCEDCGGTWNGNTCRCDCGFYKGNACKFIAGGGCLCGQLYRACK